ncbi:hypothetical protein [Geobacter grbiciae]|uniref:hypothetical protein n=1 Tax=Geobacter grbiciae TaxID=155042 RepID=UPI001C034F91|nr:hypothetical protein [Geobacter grbiciae]MBT1076472.1 hypothetical protein [Geobacter grbiciae]
MFIKTLGLFVLTALAEILGCYLLYLWLRENVHWPAWPSSCLRRARYEAAAEGKPQMIYVDGICPAADRSLSAATVYLTV